MQEQSIQKVSEKALAKQQQIARFKTWLEESKNLNKVLEVKK